MARCTLAQISHSSALSTSFISLILEKQFILVWLGPGDRLDRMILRSLPISSMILIKSRTTGFNLVHWSNNIYFRVLDTKLRIRGEGGKYQKRGAEKWVTVLQDNWQFFLGITTDLSGLVPLWGLMSKKVMSTWYFSLELVMEITALLISGNLTGFGCFKKNETSK